MDKRLIAVLGGAGLLWLATRKPAQTEEAQLIGGGMGGYTLGGASMEGAAKDATPQSINYSFPAASFPEVPTQLDATSKKAATLNTASQDAAELNAYFQKNYGVSGVVYEQGGNLMFGTATPQQATAISQYLEKTNPNTYVSLASGGVGYLTGTPPAFSPTSTSKKAASTPTGSSVPTQSSSAGNTAFSPVGTTSKLYTPVSQTTSSPPKSSSTKTTSTYTPPSLSSGYATGRF
jgi:hypothetical protein